MNALEAQHYGETLSGSQFAVGLLMLALIWLAGTFATDELPRIRRRRARNLERRAERARREHR